MEKQTVAQANVVKKDEKHYAVEYWEHSSLTIDVDATSREEAEQKARLMVENGEVDFSQLELGDCGYEVIE